jgi:hypothetical protein
VKETIAVASSGASPCATRSPPLHLPSVADSEAKVRVRVDELIDLLGLGAYRDKYIRELSTGSRRVVDLACVLAHGPRVLFLDEPSSGIAQREAEALRPLLLRIRAMTGASLLSSSTTSRCSRRSRTDDRARSRARSSRPHAATSHRDPSVVKAVSGRVRSSRRSERSPPRVVRVHLPGGSNGNSRFRQRPPAPPAAAREAERREPAAQALRPDRAGRRHHVGVIEPSASSTAAAMTSGVRRPAARPSRAREPAAHLPGGPRPKGGKATSSGARATRVWGA